MTRNIFWNPKVIVDNAYAPSSWFYRVNSVFYDPSIYGRFLVVAILASLVLVLFAPGAAAWSGLVVAVIAWAGLVPSFSQSSFVALGVGVVVALAVLWRRRSVVPIALAIGALLAVSLGVPQARHRILGKAGLSHATGGRSKLVTEWDRAGAPPSGDRRRHGRLPPRVREADAPARARSRRLPPRTTRRSRSRPRTGLPGLALLVWLVAAALLLAFRSNPIRGPTGRARLAFGLALLAIVVHSLFYNALFEDPLFWGALALSAVAARRAAA